MGDGAVLERDRPYLVPLIEELALPEDVRGKANPKSSTGRLDVFTRVITDRHHRFDDVRAGYRGRLYLAAYPEIHGGTNMLQAVQAAFGRPPGDLWLVGLYNLTDDLDAAETSALAEIVARWWNEPLLRFTATELQLMAAGDDLVLDGSVEATLPLGTARGGARLPRP